eukprot:XP_020404359.1 proline-, glutamic acid- and leucine-rich protein 1-like [Zea mays]
MAVRQTGGRDHHRGIRISDALAGGPQSAGVAPSAPPAPWTRAKGLQAAPLPQVAQGGRRKRGDAGCVAPTGHLFWTPQKRHRTAGEAEAAGSQAQGVQRRVLTHPLLVRASSPSAPKVVPPPPDTMFGGSGSQQHASAGSGASDPPPTSATTPTATAASTTAMPSSTLSATAEEVPTAPTPAIEGDAGGASSSIPPPTLEEPEVVFGRWLRSGAEPKAALFASKRSELERDRKDYKKDLQKVYAQELEASWKEKRLAKREEAFNQREEVVTELRAKLSAMNKILEEQQIQQTMTVERIQKWERELEDKASN